MGFVRITVRPVGFASSLPEVAAAAIRLASSGLVVIGLPPRVRHGWSARPRLPRQIGPANSTGAPKDYAGSSSPGTVMSRTANPAAVSASLAAVVEFALVTVRLS